MSDVVERFLRYVKIDTQSAYDVPGIPSTQKQFDLAHLLVGELKALGLVDVTLDEHGYIMATLPGNTRKAVPTIGLIAHMDTSPDMSGTNVKPQIVKNYDGGDIVLNAKDGIVLSPREFPELLRYKGQDLITTDGTTLLGADDKAGLAVIMASLRTLVEHPEIEHGTVRVGFTPDEEVGHGADLFDVKKFAADFAYTLDGGQLGELQYENFNAARALVYLKGLSVHPGEAKNKMINAVLVAHELIGLLPADARPENTEGYEGFFHVDRFNGTTEEANFRVILRDHDRAKFEAKKALMLEAAETLNQRYGPGTVRVELSDQYFNMKEVVAPDSPLIQVAKRAMEAVGVTPLIIPIRGGTDGARLSYMGLPTPNLFAGGHNFHGRFEYIPIPSMEKAVQVTVKILELFTAEA